MAMLLLFCVVFMTGLGVVGIHYSMYFSISPVGAGGAGSAKYHQILAGQLTQGLLYRWTEQFCQCPLGEGF